MSREMHFYFLVTGLTVPLLLSVYYFLVLMPATLNHSITPGQFWGFIVGYCILSPPMAIAISIGNKGLRACPTWILHVISFTPAPLGIVSLIFI